MKSLATILLLAMPFFLSACAPRANKQAPAVAAADETTAVEVKPPTPSAADLASVVQGNNQFALDVYAKLRDQQGNLFLSPSSISTALAMTSNGARGETASQMIQALRFSREQDQANQVFRYLHFHFNTIGRKPGCQLNVANALWGQKGEPFLVEFVKPCKDNYGAGLQEVDFGQTDAARQTINAWVEKKTKEKIKDLVPPSVLTPNTRLVLTNAIYFKGDWERAFKKETTETEPFQRSPGQKVNVSMMHRTGSFMYLDGGDFQALELPYQGKDLSMVVVLPKKVDGLAEFEKSLTATKLGEWLKKLRWEEVALALPRFRVTKEIRLKEVLSAMGMAMAFTPDNADFSGMTGKKELFLSEVLHKAFVAVSEEGTEAAAATAAVVEKKEEPPKPRDFRADHPFIFLIRDRTTGSLLFLGRVTDPQQ